MSPVAETSVNRMTEVPAFQVPADPEAVDSYWRALEQGKRPSPEILERLADPIVVTAVNDVIGTSFTVEVAPADYGRGASGYAAALQIVEAIGGVGGATATLYHGAKITVEAYRAVRRRLGHRPLVSLGAAKHLATADLFERTGFDDFLLVGAGDVATNPHDQSFTGADQFWVVFGRFPDLFVYIVDGAGRCDYMGSTTIYRDGWLEYEEGPGGRRALPLTDDEED